MKISGSPANPNAVCDDQPLEQCAETQRNEMSATGGTTGSAIATKATAARRGGQREGESPQGGLQWTTPGSQAVKQSQMAQPPMQLRQMVAGPSAHIGARDPA